MDQKMKFLELLESTPDVSFSPEAGEMMADHLVASGAVIVPKRAGKVFPFRNGCLSRKDWGNVVGACKVIGESVWDAPSHGFTEDGMDYIPVDLMREPEEVEEALCTVIAFFRQVYGFDVYEEMTAFDEAIGR